MLNDVVEALSGPAYEPFEPLASIFLGVTAEEVEVADPAVPSPFPHEPRARVDEFKDQVKQQLEETMNAQAAWKLAIERKIREGKSRLQATKEVVREQPALQIAYLKECNRERPTSEIHRL